MFDFLKKKVNSFAEKIKEKLEKKEELIVREEKAVEEPKKELIETLQKEKDAELTEELKEEKIIVSEEEQELEEDLSPEEKEVLADIKEEEAKLEREEKAQAETKRKEEQKRTEIQRKREEKEIESQRKKAIKELEREQEKEIQEKAEKESLEEKKEEVFEEEFEEEIEKEIFEEKIGKEEKEAELKEERIEAGKLEEKDFEPEEPQKFKEIELGKKIDSDLLKERELKAKVSLTSGIKKFFTGKIKIEEKDVKGFLEDFELALMESDVEQGTAGKITEGIRKELVGKEVSGKDITETLKKEIALILEKIMDVPSISIEEKMKEKKPFVILFLGPNGAGKTTTIAKIAFKFKKKGKQVILAAADTFRAASIEQIETHAERIGVRVIKQQYGSDPAAVAFDAVKAAEAKNMDLVLIDSAGRQETNTNLMNELKKIDRVVKPDLKLFVGEAMSGNSLFEQAKEFSEKIGFDGFVLTKIDTDAKGGTAISLISALKKPVVFVGTGQGYDDLIAFTPKFITERIIKN
ncbi:MAG: signal recognition particle-docking protein FtsY [Candidatus Micrarchaeota archaeon]